MNRDKPIDTVENDAYLHSCKCPICGHKIFRKFDEAYRYCEMCGQKLHIIPFSKQEVDEALFEHEQDEYED